MSSTALDVVFEAVPLRGLDDASRARVQAAGRAVLLADGEVLFEPGSDADALFVVLRGQVCIEGDGETIRVAEAGHTIGEEASVGVPRRARARAQGDSEVFEVSAALLHRAWTRAGGRPAAAAERRRLERAVIGDLLRVAPFSRGLGPWAHALLLDGARLRTVEADGFLARAGDPTSAAALLLEGVVHLRAGAQVRALAMSPDALGVDAARANTPWPQDVVAAGTCQVVWIRAEALRAALDAGAGDPDAPAREAHRHDLLRAMQADPTPTPIDVHRLSRARSLLVIDQDACVRCGQCTRACASGHADGLARMTRTGPRLLARLQSPTSAVVPWLMAQACQHCTSPACLPDCPTGAITRDRQGVVQIDPGLCTGCGACAKACPWDAIELAARPPGTPEPADGPFESVAVKCDLCSGTAQGPACVQVCPTEALVRVDAGRELLEVAALLDRPPPAGRPPRTPWPWVTSFAMAGVLAVGAWGAAGHQRGWIVGAGPGLWAGWVAALAMAASLAYAAVKRRRPRWGRGSMWMSLHAVLGTCVLAAGWAHTGGAHGGIAGVLATVTAASVGLGLFGVLVYRVVPPRLTRLEARARLPEDREGDLDALMRAIGGRSEVLKRLTASVLLPYAHRFGGGMMLALSGRSLAQEGARLRARLVDTLGEDRVERIEGLDEVLAIVVALRAGAMRRGLTLALRGWLIPHVVLSAVAAALLVAHALPHLLPGALG